MEIYNPADYVNPFYTTLNGSLFSIDKERAKTDGFETFDIQLEIYDQYFNQVMGNDVFQYLPEPKINFIRIPPLYYPIYKKNPNDLISIVST